MSLTMQPLFSRDELTRFQAQPELAKWLKFYHTWQWGLFQQSLGKSIDRIGWYDQSELVASALVIQEASRFGPYCYLPRGPLLNYDNPALLRAVLKDLQDKYQGTNNLFLRIDPALGKTNLSAVVFADLKFRPAAKWFVQVGRAWIADLFETEDAQMHWLSEHGMRSNVPRYLRRAIKAGVAVRRSSEMKDLETFLALLGGLDHRKGGIGRFPDQYYRQQFEILAPSGLEYVYLAELDGRALATALITVSGIEASYLHGASSDEHRDLHAPQYMHLEIMKDVRNLGASRYNFWGVIDSPQNHPSHYGYGYSTFKQSFGGYQELYIPAQDYPINSFKYKLQWLEEKQHMLRHKID
ncbi:MAG: lipid II:glycine glycyltransferase FemX [Candidatus Saccharimonadia bacterium]